MARINERVGELAIMMRIKRGVERCGGIQRPMFKPRRHASGGGEPVFDHVAGPRGKHAMIMWLIRLNGDPKRETGFLIQIIACEAREGVARSFVA